jgi:hypothetical protein
MVPLVPFESSRFLGFPVTKDLSESGAIQFPEASETEMAAMSA